MPILDGFEFREQLLNSRENGNFSVPYIFLTTAESYDYRARAYSLSVQGFFIKPTDFTECKAMLGDIIAYWQKSAPL